MYQNEYSTALEDDVEIGDGAAEESGLPDDDEEEDDDFSDADGDVDDESL